MNQINFPLIVTRVTCRHETEGDYDTAIDVVTYSTEDVFVTVETPYGLEIGLTYTSISSSHSYLEPDFDLLEETGEVQYESHREPDRDSTSVYRQATYSLPVEVPLITRSEYAELVRKMTDGVVLPDHLDSYRFHEIENPDRFREEEDGIGLPADVFDAIIDGSGPASRHPVRRPIVIAMPSHIVQEIRAAENRLRVRRRSNMENRINNKAEVALFELLGPGDQDDIGLQFPKLPEYKGAWWPVYWSPITGSKERYTVFVVAVGEDGQVCIRSTIRPEALAGKFGDKALVLEKMLRLIQGHIETFLTQVTDFSEWKSMLTGFYLGDRRPSLADNIRQVAAQGICFEAALADPAFADLNQE